jgi:heptosyltransferase-3
MELRRDIAAALHGLGRPPRLTVVRAGGLGDTVLVLPALQTLRRLVPGAELNLVGSAWAERLRPLAALPFRVVRFDSPALTPLFGASPQGDPSGAFARADAVILYVPGAQDALVRNVRRLCRGPAITWPVDPPAGLHAAAHFAGAVAKRPEVRLPDLRVPAELRAWARGRLDELVGPGVRPPAVHPGSGGRRKCWPAERFAELIRGLGRRVVMLRGPADDAACDALSALAPAVELAGLEVAQAGAVLAECGLYVGNDSGLTHLAAGLGVPTVAVFGPTDPSVWRPLGRRVRVVRGEPWPGAGEVLAVCGGAGAPLG